MLPAFDTIDNAIATDINLGAIMVFLSGTKRIRTVKIVTKYIDLVTFYIVFTALPLGTFLSIVTDSTNYYDCEY